MIKLQVLLLLMVPFGLVALYHHLSYATSRPHTLAGRPRGSSLPKIGLHSNSGALKHTEEALSSLASESAAATKAADEPLGEPGAEDDDSQAADAVLQEAADKVVAEEEEDVEQPAAKPEQPPKLPEDIPTSIPQV